MFQVIVTLNAPNIKTADRAYLHACMFPSGRRNKIDLRTGRVTMAVKWIMDWPATAADAEESLIEYLAADCLENLGVDVDNIEISECD